MKKYRYQAPVTPLRKAMTFGYFFFGWNVLALIAYQFWKKKQQNKDSNFENLTDLDIYLKMVQPGIKKEDIDVVHIKGFRQVEMHDAASRSESDTSEAK